MTHEHHHHERTVTSLNKAFILGIALNVAFVVVEYPSRVFNGTNVSHFSENDKIFFAFLFRA